MKKDLLVLIGDKLLGKMPEKERDLTIVVLVIVLVIVWIVDVLIPDPLPFVDEIVLPILSILISVWYPKYKKKKIEEAKTVTVVATEPPEEA